LQRLGLKNNQLTGTIPNLANLQYFKYSGNQLIIDCNAVTEISTVECESLLELYHNTNGKEWDNNRGWNITYTPCNWYGITCENGNLTEINFVMKGGYSDISDNNLNGTLPNFRSLPNLKKLIIPGDKLMGTIPDFSGLPKLQMLYLSANKLTGTIPDFSALPNLQKLDLSGNQLTGAIPDFSALPNLRWLWLNDNNLTGIIPDFSNLPNLIKLSLSNNSICKDINIKYSSWLINELWQNELPTFPDCPINQLPTTIKIQLNQSRYTIGNPISLDMQVDGHAMVDLYVAILFPSGDFKTITYPLTFSQFNVIQVYQPAIPVTEQKTYPIMVDFPLPNIKKGQYQAYGVLVTAGTDPNDQNNWIHFDNEGFEVY